MLKTLCVTLVAAGLFGCVAPPARQRVVIAAPAARPMVATAAPAPAVASSDEEDLVPPVPTFTSVSDCELAYGPGQCGTGAAVYESAHLDAPPDANVWFMPFAYGVMTGVLVNRYFAPPSVYVSTVEYRHYVAPVIIDRYRVVDHRTIEVYRRAPVSVRTEAFRAGPARYSPARGVITSAIAPTHAPGANVAPHVQPPARVQAPPVSTSQRSPVSAPLPPTAVKPVVGRAETPAPVVHERPHQAVAATPMPAPAPRPSAAPPAEHKAKPCNPSLPKSASNCAA